MTDYLKKRPGSSFWQLRVPVPVDVQLAYGRREFTKSLGEHDRAKAAAKSWPILQALHSEWATIRAERDLLAARASRAPTENEMLGIAQSFFDGARSRTTARRLEIFASDPEGYLDNVARRERGLAGWVKEIDGESFERWTKAAENALIARGFLVERNSDWFKNLAGMIAEAVIAAEDVANRRDRGDLAAKPSSEVLERAAAAASEVESGRKNVALDELVESYMRQWKAGMNPNRDTNTEQQKRSTFKLFSGFWGNKAIRGVLPEHAAEFRDKIKLLDPTWSRSPSARELGWADLIAKFGDRPHGLSDATMNRHMRALQSLWGWAKKRGHCEGENPFGGFHVKLNRENTRQYVPWEPDELTVLLNPPPRRSDLLEVMIVGMYTGMRLDEIASLTWGRLRTDGEGKEAISYFDIGDAKTAAGVRQVPVHDELAWLLSRDRGDPGDRIWPNFNEEGAGNKPGADASKEFSSYKIKRGFRNRRKTFHSFRKNVTRIMELARVPENEWAQVFGHERGFTYKTYNPDGITLARKAEIISLISYPAIAVPHPQYGQLGDPVSVIAS